MRKQKNHPPVKILEVQNLMYGMPLPSIMGVLHQYNRTLDHAFSLSRWDSLKTLFFNYAEYARRQN